MTNTSAGSDPIPPAKKDDSEDVAWALSTAEAMYARGDRDDALKWLRRAAEAASEAQADDRALELAKAAADLASSIGPVSELPTAPSYTPHVPPMAARPPMVAPPTPAPPLPPPPARHAASARPPAPPSRPAPPLPPVAGASKGAAAPAKPPIPPKSRPGSPVRPLEPRRSRRSRPDLTPGKPVEEPSPSSSPELAPPTRRRRASKPSADEMTPSTPAVQVPAPVSSSQLIDDMDAWPTRSLSGEGGEASEDKTRIGVPAYEANAKVITHAAVVEPLAAELRPSQALRVVVWRAADGVHIAPVGTRVEAITVEAVLVSLDPAADLTAWLSNK